MDIGDIKRKIVNIMNNNGPKQILEILEQNQNRLFCDIEMYTLQANCYCMLGDLDTAIKCLEQGIQEKEYNFDLNYNLAVLYEQKEDYIKAFKYLTRSEYLINEQLTHELQETQERILDLAQKKASLMLPQDATMYLTKIKKIIEKEVLTMQNIGIYFPSSSKEKNFIGDYFNKDYFVGLYNYYLKERLDVVPCDMNTQALYKVEIYKAEHTKSKVLENDNIYIVPIASKNLESQITIREKQREYSLKNKLANQYYYYRVNGPAQVLSNEDIEIGKPIVLNKKKSNKDLVLNIFVDGLSQKVLEGYGLLTLMPNTYSFFDKGTVCSNAYVTGEWTYVNLASFFTGRSIPNHKIFNPNFTSCILKRNKMLSEIFQEQGYFTAKIDGDWRSTPASGYIRGIDRTIYQPAVLGMNLEEVIMELIEHMETFKETNQFIWTCISDLHDVADGFEARSMVQSKLDLIHRQKKDAPSTTSVQTEYDECKTQKYIEQIKRVDLYLGMLFNYIETHFQDENIVVSLVSDHGQGYLVNRGEGEEFLCDKRVKVPMLFRGKGFAKGECKELIEALDLMPILCKSCNIPLETAGLDCNLPRYFGGNTERDYVYSESIFPEATYKAAIHMKEKVFFFETQELVEQDGRVKLEPFKVSLKKMDSSDTIQDDVLLEKLIQIVYDHMKSNRIY